MAGKVAKQLELWWQEHEATGHVLVSVVRKQRETNVDVFLSFLTFIQYWIPVYKIQGDSSLLSDTPLEMHPQTLPVTIL